MIVDNILTFPFVQERIIPLLDILLLAYALYLIFSIFIRTRAVQLARGLVFIAVFYVFAQLFNLQTNLWLLNFLGPGLVTVIAIIFQPELRRIFITLGKVSVIRAQGSQELVHIDAVVSALVYLAELRRGALVVFVRRIGLKNTIETGQSLDSNINSALIVSIFSHDNALHDGAIVIQGDRIVAANVFLPLSDSESFNKHFGTRHRAALGIAEETDAVVLVLSEETGQFSLAHDSEFFPNIHAEDLRSQLAEILGLRIKKHRRQVPAFVQRQKMHSARRSNSGGRAHGEEKS